jgi:hypothetical protein
MRIETLSPYSKQRLPVLDRLPIFDIDFRDLSADLSLNFIHQIHRLNYAHDGIGLNLRANRHERIRCRRRRPKECADDWRIDHVQTGFTLDMRFASDRSSAFRRPGHQLIQRRLCSCRLRVWGG